MAQTNQLQLIEHGELSSEVKMNAGSLNSFIYGNESGGILNSTYSYRIFFVH